MCIRSAGWVPRGPGRRSGRRGAGWREKVPFGVMSLVFMGLPSCPGDVHTLRPIEQEGVLRVAQACYGTWFYCQAVLPIPIAASTRALFDGLVRSRFLASILAAGRDRGLVPPATTVAGTARGLADYIVILARPGLVRISDSSRRIDTATCR